MDKGQAAVSKGPLGVPGAARQDTGVGNLHRRPRRDPLLGKERDARAKAMGAHAPTVKGVLRMTWHQWDDDTTQAALDGARLAYRHPQVRQSAALEDVEQDALEYIATLPDEVEAYKANGWTHVLVKLRLIDKYRYDK